MKNYFIGEENYEADVFNGRCFLFFSLKSNAGTIEVGPVGLDNVTVIGASAFGHQSGNLEIKITNGMGSLVGVNCDADYVTTKSSAPNFKEMLAVLLAAQLSQKSVRIGITDDPTQNAFSGRCSLVEVTILK